MGSKVYVVWDNDNYGSLFSPSQDEIDSIYSDVVKANLRRDHLNKGKHPNYTKARVQAFEVKND